MTRHDHKLQIEIGEKIGGFVVVEEIEIDLHYGSRVNAECTRCGKRFAKVLSQLRSRARDLSRLGKPGPFCFGCANAARAKVIA